MNHHILTGKLDITSNLLVGSSHLFVDTDNNRVGLVTADPQAGLHVNSNVYVNTDLRVGPAGANQVIINDSTNPGRIVAKSFVGDGSGLQNTPPGPQGDAATIDVGTVTTGVPGSSASVTNSGSTSAAIFDFTIPRGDTGAQGSTGDAATISVGSVTTGVPGSSASVTNSGTTNAATLDFTIPRGDTGAQGSTGDAATISIGTVTTGVPGSSASVTNSGTTNAATLDFTIPRGDTGTTIFTEDGDDIYRQTGNVGIGTNTPTEKLHVNGNIGVDWANGRRIIMDYDDSYRQGLVLDASTRTMTLFSTTNDSGGAIAFNTRGGSGSSDTDYGTERMRILKSGNVGIGTTNPNSKLEVLGTTSSHNTTIYPLTVSTKSSSSTEVQEGIGTGVEFRVERRHTDNLQNDCGAIRVYGASGIPGTSDKWNMAFRVRDNDTFNEPMTIQYNGNVGIGTTTPYAKLHVYGQSGNFTTSGVSPSRASYFINSSGLYVNTTGNFGAVSIYGSNDILAGAWIGSFLGSISASDERIKKEIVDVEDGEALSTLRLLKPKRYKYRDEVKRGIEPVWGFIAQEVADILPYSTQKRRECVPTIYELANVSASNVITFTNFNTTNLESNTIKLFDTENNEHMVKLVSVLDEHSIQVEEDLTEWMGAVDEDGNVVSGNQIFVYGEEVDDFVFLKKEVFIPICVSSIQELDRRLEADKARIVELETQQQSDKARIVELETQLQSEKSKLATVELLVASLVTRVGDLERSLI